MKLTLKTVNDYYKKWRDGGEGEHPECRSEFINMLQKKAYLAGLQKRTVYAFDGMKTAQELNSLLCIADDNYNNLGSDL